MTQFQLIKNAIVHGDRPICKSYGPTPVMTVAPDLAVHPNQENVPFTITEAGQGTMLKLFFVDKDLADGDEWFMFDTFAVYLTTSRSMRGFERRWSSAKTFGQLVLECVTKEQIQNMNHDMSYTIFLHHMENDILGTLNENYVHICCIYDKNRDRFVHPLDDYFVIPDGFRKATTLAEESGCSTVDLESPLMREGDGDVFVRDGHPLLMTYYCGNELVSIKYETVNDHNLLSIRTLNNDVFFAWMIAKWLEYPGLPAYEEHFGIGLPMKSRYEHGLKKFQAALDARYAKRFFKFSYSIYKCGIEDLVENHLEDYTREELINEGFRRLYGSAKDTRYRHKIVEEFYTHFMS